MNKRVWLPACLLFILSFLIRYWALHQTAYANGWDAYFYLVQLKALLEEGSMHSSDLSLIYPFFLLLKLFIPDYVSTFKIGAALLAATFSLALYLLSYRLTTSVWIALLIGCFSLYSPELTYFAAQYPKNLLGLIFLLCLITFGNNWKLALLFLFLGFFGHRLTALLGLGYLSVLYISLYQKWRYVAYATAVLLLFVSIGVLLPGLLSFYDWERFSGELSMQPQLAWLSFQQSLEQAGFSTFWRIELWMSLLFFLAGIYHILNQKVKDNAPTVALLLMLALLVFPLLRWSTEGFAFRLIQVFVLLSPLLLLPLLRRLPTYLLQVGSVLLFLLSFFSWTSYQPSRHDPPYALYDFISQKASARLDGHQVSLLIMHKSLAEFYTFTLGVDALPWEPEYELAEGSLWRIAAGFQHQELVHAAGPKGVVYDLSFGYTLLPEGSWENALQHWEARQDEYALEKAFSWRNPHKLRPAYLLKNK